MMIYDLDDLVDFQPEGHTKQVFFESEKVKAQVLGLEGGQQIPPCQMEYDVIFVVLEGKGKIIVDGEEEALQKHSWVFVSKEKESRSLKATARLAVLAIQIRR